MGHRCTLSVERERERGGVVGGSSVPRGCVLMPIARVCGGDNHSNSNNNQ